MQPLRLRRDCNTTAARPPCDPATVLRRMRVAHNDRLESRMLLLQLQPSTEQKTAVGMLTQF